jgi:hypothetical protein
MPWAAGAVDTGQLKMSVLAASAAGSSADRVGKALGEDVRNPPLVNLAAHLEREQDGQVTEFGSQILPRGLFHAHLAPFTHEKSMHLADRLCRAGMLAADDACTLAMYRRLTAHDIVAAWDVEPLPPMQDIMCRILGMHSRCAKCRLFFY